MMPVLATLVLLLWVGTPTAQEPPDLEQARRVAEVLAQLREPGEDTDVIKSLIPLGSAALPAVMAVGRRIVREACLTARFAVR